MNNHTQNKNVQVAAIYARSATENPTGIREQQRACKAAARREGFNAPEEFRFIDDGWSGATTERPSFQSMVDLVESGEAPFGRVYVHDRSRLGRFSDPRQHFAIEMAFRSHGIEVRYADEEAIDWDDRTGAALASAMKAFTDSSQTDAGEASDSPEVGEAVFTLS